MCVERRAEIEPDDVGRVVQVLLEQRLVEPELMAQLRDSLRGGVRTKHLPGGVPRHYPVHQERGDLDDPDDQQQRPEPPYQESEGWGFGPCTQPGRWPGPTSVTVPSSGMGVTGAIFPSSVTSENPAARASFRQQIDAFLTSDKYHGLMVDFEDFPKRAQPGYLALLGELSSDLHASGLKLYVSVPARDRDFDYAAIAARTDGIMPGYRSPYV